MRPMRPPGAGGVAKTSPAVNRYNVHLAALKSLNMPADLHFSKESSMNVKPDNGLCGPQRRQVQKAMFCLTGVAAPPACGLAVLEPELRSLKVGAPPTAPPGDDYSLSGEPVTLSWDQTVCCSDRIDLDRRGLRQCPLLDSLSKLRILNLQHNLISHVDLAPLPSLAFLDLSSNQLTETSGLQHLACLRVLLLGNNRIQQICGLDNLIRLQVLDLHNNQVSKIEQLSQLRELQVLNLSGNHISSLDNLQGLESLTDLSLQRNNISTLTELCVLPSLQRLFLSLNSLRRVDELACLALCPSLCELSLDGNPVAVETCYRQTVLRCGLHLKYLDMKRITDEERRSASSQAKKEEDKKRETQKQSLHKERRRQAIHKASQQWGGCRGGPDTPPQQDPSPENSPAHGSAHSPPHTNGLAEEPPPEEPRLSPGSAERGSETRLRTNSRPSSPRDHSLQDTGGASPQSLSLSDCHLAELDGDTLRLIGPGALEALERGWGVQTAGAVTVVTFRYIQYDAIVPTLPRLRVKFPSLSHLVFLETNVSRLPQLAALAQVRRLAHVTVQAEGNPVVGLALWRPFLIYRLHRLNLQRVNGLEVTMNDVIAAERVFGTLGHIAAMETPRCRLLLLLEESRKRQLQFLLDGRGRKVGLSPEDLRDNGRLQEGLSRALFNYPNRDWSTDSPEGSAVEVCERYLQAVVKSTSACHQKGEAMHALWPCLFLEMVRDSVVEMKDQEGFRHASLDRHTH